MYVYDIPLVPVSCIFNMNFPLEVNSWGYFASPSCCVARCIKTTHVGLHGFLGLFNVGSNEMRWQRWHLFGGFRGGYGAVSYLLHSCLKIWFWDVLRLAEHNHFSSRHSKNEVCFSPCQLRQLARVARCWIIVGKERASSLLRGSGWPDDSHLSGEPTSCFKRMDPQSTAKVLFKGVWFDWFLFLLVPTLLYSGCSVQLLTFRSGCTAAGAETAHLAAATATTGSRETFGS